MKDEPVLITGAIAALVQAVLGLLIAFGVDLTDAQTAAVLGTTGAVLALGAAIFGRSKVKPMSKIARGE